MSKTRLGDILRALRLLAKLKENSSKQSTDAGLVGILKTQSETERLQKPNRENYSQKETSMEPNKVPVKVSFSPEQLELMWALLAKDPERVYSGNLPEELLELQEWEWVVASYLLQEVLEELEQSPVH
jgi:hypothetical protein